MVRLNRTYIRAAVSLLIVATTIAAFAYYFVRNPQTLQGLATIRPWTLLLLFGLYGLFMVSLVYIQRATIRLCDLTIPPRENATLVMYSSIVNFFGPLQSGPGFRAVYLKKRHDVNLKKYTAATLLYYGFYALFSGFLLLSFAIGAWSLVLCVATLVLVRLIAKKVRYKQLNHTHVGALALASLAQVLLMVVIYFVQILSFMPAVNIYQAMTYTGAANFALFVSLTPGAIGFRESFLLVSQRLHGISSDVIVSASLVDRGVYILMLLALAVIVFGFHAGDILKSKSKKTGRQPAGK